MILHTFASIRGVLLAATAAALFTLAPSISLAQDDDPPAQAGRLSSITGTVSIQTAGSDDWGRAFPNLPLGPGDRIFTDSDGRAEIQVGQTYLRVGPNSDVSLVDGSPNSISFGVAQGAVHIRCIGLWQGQSFNVSTPNGSASFNQGGELRVDVIPDDDATVFTDLAYDVYVSGANGYGQDLANGQALELSGSNPVYPQWLQASGPDDLDYWSQKRDQQILHANSYRYVSPEIPGAAELDANGEWLPGTDYGAIWFPNNVPAGWAPYHNGHWVNHEPWGWVWVEDEPWGYAPFHYGRWVSFAGRWGWVPGPPAEHPVWSPALVVFAGGIHFGGVGVSAWFPLGPGEAYRPWYHASPRYIDRVNISNMGESRHVHVEKTYVNIVNVTNVTNVTNITYVNRTTAVTAMRNDDFAAGRPARQSAVAIDTHQMDHVQVVAQPEPKPTPRAIIAAPPARPVPVKVERPVLINQQGQAVVAKLGAVPVVAPVKAAPPVAKPLAGRVVVAPPPGAKPVPAAAAHPVPGTPVATPMPGVPNRPVASPSGQPAPKPVAPPVVAPPAARPAPQPMAPPAARPAPSPTPGPIKNANPAPAPKPAAPSVLNPVPHPAPPAARPTQMPPPRQQSKPTPPPTANPLPPPAARPTPPPALPPAPKPTTPPPTAKPAPQPTSPPVRQQPTPPPSPQPARRQLPPPPPPVQQRPVPPPAARPTPPPAAPQAARPAPQPPPKQPAKDTKSDKDKKPNSQ